MLTSDRVRCTGLKNPKLNVIFGPTGQSRIRKPEGSRLCLNGHIKEN